MAEVTLQEKTKEARTYGKRGIRTKATIRNNAYDRKFHSRHAIVTFPDESEVPYSLDKGKRWERVDDLKKHIASNNHDAPTPEVNAEREDIKEVMEVQVHLREEIGSLSWKHRGQLPRLGFSGGCFGMEKRGRDYTRAEVVVCAECGAEQVFPAEEKKIRATSWLDTPEVLEERERRRKERKEKAEKDRERREQRKRIRAPKVEKKDLRKDQPSVDDSGNDDEAQCSAEEPHEERESDSESLDEDNATEGSQNDSNNEGEDEDEEEEEVGEEEEDSCSDDSDSRAADDEEEEIGGDHDGNDHATEEKEVAEQNGREEDSEQQEGREENKKALRSQERRHITVKEGRIIVQKPFEKGQYPMYRETNWKYSSPCMCCVHSQGPMWIMKGMGEKSKKKTKGFRKIQRRDLKYTLKGEL